MYIKSQPIKPANALTHKDEILVTSQKLRPRGIQKPKGIQKFILKAVRIFGGFAVYWNQPKNQRL